jgi:cysteinyl-tRNA synthetase
MDLSLTNTLTRRKERFTPQDPSRVTMYVCGPTVYNLAHIGNARSAIAFDLLFRVLRHSFGEDCVVYARNLTDVDDKIIARAAESGEPIAALTARYAKAYEEDMAALGALAPTLQPKATEHIEEMCALIGELETKGAAYRGESGVWFSVAADADYGKLSGRTLEDNLAGARVEAEADKRHPADFALWKAAKPGELAFESAFGPGRPGWHIECSAMIRAQLGETIDIHCGGVDLIFPHHENEIAQSETASKAPLARFWLHNGFLDMAGEKMSKSVGNVVLARDLLAAWPGEVVRWALLSAHYRAPLDWSDALLEQSKSSLDRLYNALRRLGGVEADPQAQPPAAFFDALGDDLNTPQAMAELFALATEANKATEAGREADAETRRALKGQLLKAGALMGFLQADPEAWFKGGDDLERIEALVAERVAARSAKNWAEADRLRHVLADLGVEVMDGPQGSTWRRT